MSWRSRSRYGVQVVSFPCAVPGFEACQAYRVCVVMRVPTKRRWRPPRLLILIVKKHQILNKTFEKKVSKGRADFTAGTATTLM